MESTAVVNERYQVVLERVRSSTLTDDLPAEDLLLSRNVLFRALKPELAAEKDFVERFRKQVQMAASLTHPNIVGVYDWGRERNGFADRPGPVYFVITERQNGRTVQSYIDDKGAIPIERAIHIMLGVSSAIGYAHRNNALHGGLRPNVVTVSPSGLVKVADFGVDQLLPENTDLEVARWAAPETIRGEDPTERTDVYALGQLLYLLVTGRAPFNGSTLDEVRRKQLSGVPAAPRKLNPDLPRALEVIIGRCLAKQPTDRFSSVNDLRSALVRLRETVGGSSEPARPRVPEAGRASLDPVGPDEPTRIDIPPMRQPAVGDASVVGDKSDRSVGPSPTPTRTPVVPTPTPTPTPSTTPTVAPKPELAPAAKLVAPTTSKPTTSKPTTSKPTAEVEAPQPPVATTPPSAPTDVRKALTAEPKPTPPRSTGSAFDAPTVATPRPTFESTPPDDDVESKPTAKEQAKKTREQSQDARVAAVIKPSAVVHHDDPLAMLDNRRSARRWLMLLGALLVVLAGLLALLANSLKDTTTPMVVVPNVVSMNRASAEAALSDLGLSSSVEYATNEQFRRDVVVEQRPAEGRQVQAGSQVQLIVSSGDGILRVPDVVGRSQDVAESTLRTKGFSVKVETRQDASVAPGNVISQSPTAETEARPGDDVTIVVAAATGSGKIPDVTGKTPEEANKALITAGFRSALLSESSVAVPKGVVIRTDPAAGKDFDRNATVKVYVSQGASIKVPSVFGQNEGAAIAALRSQGFEVERQPRLVADPNSIGIVLDQTPKQGTDSIAGQKVVIIVGELDPTATTTTTAPTGGKATIVTTTTNPSDSPLDPTSLPPKTVESIPTTALAPVATPAPTAAPTVAPTEVPTVPPTPAPTAPPVPAASTLPPIPIG
jgi:eukaryotic-like serine/threonine-protein kinase